MLRGGHSRRIQDRPPQTSTLRTADRVLNVKRLFERHHDELHAYLFRLTGDADLAADITQETFIRWVRHSPDESDARAWLFKVATNLSRDHSRVHSRRLELLREDPVSVPLATPTADPAHELEVSERRRAVREVLDAIPEKDRVILLMQQRGFSHREIAEAIGTTTGSVGTMLARALKRFTEAAAGKLESHR